jgi:hypothetical protein
MEGSIGVFIFTGRLLQQQKASEDRSYQMTHGQEQDCQDLSASTLSNTKGGLSSWPRLSMAFNTGELKKHTQ